MTENNSGAGIPAKPVQPPVIIEDHEAPTALPDHPGHIRNVSTKVGWWPLGKKKTDTSEYAHSSEPLSVTLPKGGKSPRRKVAWYWVAGAAALLLSGGVGVGITLPDPTKSKEFLALTADRDGLQSDLKSLQGRYDTLDASIKGREASIQARETAVAKADAAVKAADAGVKKREEAVTAAEKTQAANTIKEGTWTVGVDIQPGTYRAVTDVQSGCYWGIYRTGSNGSDIIENDIVSGGRPSVTLSAGQDFTTTRCGSWMKQ